jgi:hypothetical protein
MSGRRTVSASEFKANCLDILDRIRSKELERVTCAVICLANGDALASSATEAIRRIFLAG